MPVFPSIAVLCLVRDVYAQLVSFFASKRNCFPTTFQQAIVVQRLVKTRNGVEEVPLKAADIASKFRLSMLRQVGMFQVNDAKHFVRAWMCIPQITRTRADGSHTVGSDTMMRRNAFMRTGENTKSDAIILIESALLLRYFQVRNEGT